MNMDFLISRAGIRVAALDVQVTGLRLARGAASFAPQSAENVTGSMTVSLADLTAALARPEVVDQFVVGVAGLARPEFVLSDGPDGGIRITGSVEVLGRRLPVTAGARVRVDNHRIVVSFGHLEGLPLLSMLSSRLPQFVLPLALPSDMTFTDVTTEPGGIVIGFAGTDVWLSSDPRPTPPVTETAPDGDGREIP
ncbi:LmeA family phospholipid-binding protein [uncultured Jatrophihabitans sp.]|uniref:LmeA family phospholipid-binding protein n=1 Tax=uncultured Jatrophihabitans sp. TaxID=1610747 RepID=UPI0035CC1A11